MNELFSLAVSYEGTEHEFKARFERWGYTHRIAVLINESTVNFEPDEEGHYRALGDTLVATRLLRAIAEKLAQL